MGAVRHHISQLCCFYETDNEEFEIEKDDSIKPNRGHKSIPPRIIKQWSGMGKRIEGGQSLGGV